MGGTGHFTRIAPDTVFRIGGDGPLFPGIPAKHVNKTGVHTPLAKGTYVVIDFNLHAVHQHLSFFPNPFW
jgi:hypothetical protein